MRNGTLLDAFPRSPPRSREILVAILDQHNWAHATLSRNIGTKGVRERLIPVDIEAKRAALERDVAWLRVRSALADPSDVAAGLPPLLLRDELDRGDAAKLGVTALGLRHGFAAAEYERRAGVAPPVAGGRPVPHDEDMAARREVALQLGHRRQQITGAYLGGRPREAP